MNRKSFEAFIGKQVDVFLVPNIEHISGVISKCEDDYVVVGDELWAYPAILGVRPQPQKRVVQQKRVPVVNEAPVEAKPKQKEQKEQKEIKPEERKAPETNNPAANVTEEQPAENDPLPDDKDNEVKEFDLSEFAGREFSGTLVSFFYERGLWGFIESEEVKKCGIPLRDGEKVFVHMKQIIDESLRQKLMEDKNPNPQIEVAFKLSQNAQGIAADEVREKVFKLNIDEALFEEGEIEYFRRYEEIPHGEIRVKGNKLYRFDESDVVDPLLAVFLECSPSAEGQPVKFVKVMGKRGKMKATHVSASVPFPEDKINDWEKSGLIQKAKERIGIK